MSRYSLNGYIAATRLRSSRSVLVEGPTDAVFLKRCLYTLISKTSGTAKYVVDDARMLESDPAVPMGNRDKVETVGRRAHAAGVSLFCLFDREYDGFAVASEIEDNYANVNLFIPSSSVTRGHSIENYTFQDGLIVEASVHCYAEYLSPEEVSQVAAYSLTILRVCGAFAWAARQESVLERCRSILEPECWNAPADGMLTLNDACLRKAMTDRGIAPATADAVLRETQTGTRIAIASSDSACRWFCHGGISFKGLWTGLTRAAMSLNNSIHYQTTCGQKDELWRVIANKASELFVDAPPPGLAEVFQFVSPGLSAGAIDAAPADSSA